MKLQPLHLEILLHYNRYEEWFLTDVANAGTFARAVEDATIDLYHADLLEQNTSEFAQGGWVVSERGVALIKFLCDTPVPERVVSYVLPRKAIGEGKA